MTEYMRFFAVLSEEVLSLMPGVAKGKKEALAQDGEASLMREGSSFSEKEIAGSLLREAELLRREEEKALFYNESLYSPKALLKNFEKEALGEEIFYESLIPHKGEIHAEAESFLKWADEIPLFENTFYRRGEKNEDERFFEGTELLNVREKRGELLSSVKKDGELKNSIKIEMTGTRGEKEMDMEDVADFITQRLCQLMQTGAEGFYA